MITDLQFFCGFSKFYEKQTSKVHRDIYIYIYTSRTHLLYISTFNCDFISEHLLFVHYKTKTKKFADFIIFFHAFSKFYKNTQNLGPIGTAFLTFIGYKQTDKQIYTISLIQDVTSLVMRTENVFHQGVTGYVRQVN